MLQAMVAALFAFLVGLAFLLYGYRLFLVMLPIWGFFAGFWLGAQSITMILGDGFLATTTGWVVGFVVGLVMAILSYLFYFVGVGFVAAAFGAALGAGIMGAIGFDSGFVVALVAIVAAVVVAGLVLMLNIQKYAIIAITALGGANALILSVLLLFGRVELDALRTIGSSIQPVLQDSFFWGMVWIVLAVLGLVWQIRANRAYTFEKSQYVEGWG